MIIFYGGYASVNHDSGMLAINRAPHGGEDAWKEDSFKRRNPLVCAMSSLLLPGAGQAYTGHYVKAGFFPALEAVFLSISWFWHENAAVYNLNAKNYRAWEAFDTTAHGKADFNERALISRFNALNARFSEYNFFSWAMGAHVFNLLDAVQASNAFRNTGERNPKTAGLLAAVPGLGLGQIYNGSYSKAGMVMMGQVSLGIMAYNSQRLMDRADDNYRRLSDPRVDSLTMLLGRQYADDWYSYRSRSFTNRNMYLWYSIFFYLYSMFDAVVDAYLHDYPEKMRIAPDLVLESKRIYFSLTTTL
ncbi:MAG: hypothetical protein JW768_04095 [Chitinispirillaceae bacterium]|nr:hypothetical protein [Chitinispirillaceae bacterium]